MKHLKRFNESVEEKSTLTVREANELNQNDDDGFGEDDGVLYIQTENSWCSGTYQGQKVESHLLLRDEEPIGFAVKINGEVKHLISIYEPHGCEINEKRGLITAYGHEQVIHLWLEDGEFDGFYTR